MIKEQTKVAEIRKFLEKIYNNGAGRLRTSSRSAMTKSWSWPATWRRCADGDAGI